MNDLIAFLKARLDEDEQAARAVEDRSSPWDGQWVAEDDGNGLRTYNGHVLVAGYRHPLKPGLVDHITRHDPARVLRDVAADRKLIARYKAAVESHEEALQTLAAARKQWGGMSQEYGDAYGDTITTSARAGAFLDALEDRAERFDDHPDYQEQWRP